MWDKVCSYLVKWEVVLKSVELGRLGIGKLRLQNYVLFSSVVFAVLHKD